MGVRWHIVSNGAPEDAPVPLASGLTPQGGFLAVTRFCTTTCLQV